jgi:hypothetical protein
VGGGGGVKSKTERNKRGSTYIFYTFRFHSVGKLTGAATDKTKVPFCCYNRKLVFTFVFIIISAIRDNHKIYVEHNLKISM